PSGARRGASERAVPARMPDTKASPSRTFCPRCGWRPNRHGHVTQTSPPTDYEAPVRILLLALLAACSSEDPRTALIVNTLVREDLDLIALRPDRVAEKYAAMTQDPQTYLRGTAGIFYRDMERLDGAGLHHGDPELLWIYADPHLENVGTVFDETGAIF